MGTGLASGFGFLGEGSCPELSESELDSEEDEVELSLASMEKEPGSHRLCSGSGTGSQCWDQAHLRCFSASCIRTEDALSYIPKQLLQLLNRWQAQVHGVNRLRARDGGGVPPQQSSHLLRRNSPLAQFSLEGGLNSGPLISPSSVRPTA